MRRVLLFIAFAFYFGASVNAQSPKPATNPVAKALSKADAARPAAAPSPLALNAARASFAKLPLSFEENTGQTDSRVKFTSRGAGYNLFLTGDEAVFALRGGSTSAKCSPLAAKIRPNCADSSNKNSNESSVLWMKMLGANTSTQVSGADPLPGKINYYMGNDRSKWRTGVRQYGRVSYSGIYPGVDLTYYGNQQQLESDFILAPGANPRSIEFEVKGARESRIDPQGNLVLATSAGNVQLLRPGIYQVIDGKRREISGRYVMRGQNRIGFTVGAYNTHEKLIIDPTLVYSTFLGGSSLYSGDAAQAIAIDSAGHAYVTGQGTTADFPGSDQAGPPVDTLSDFVFVTEFDTNGSSGTTPLIYSTILSGRSGSLEVGNGIGVDGSGNAYVAGDTSATDFPMVNPFQSTYGSPVQTGFVAGLTAGTGTLIYSTYFGGRNANDTSDIQNMVADSTGKAYVVGNTTSANFPTVACSFQCTLNGPQNVVVAEFDNQGQPLYSTYLGGNSYDYGTAIAADGNGNTYVTGYTGSTNFPVKATPAPFQSTLVGGYDVFVTKLNFSGSAVSIVASTYLGGNNTDEAMGIAVDTATTPNVYVTGQTDSSGAAPNGFPTTSGAFSTADALDAKNNVTTDAFVTKLKGDFTALVYSTYLGGSGTDIGYAIGIDAAGNAYVTGSTTSTNFPLQSPLQSALGGASATNVFLTELNSTGTAPLMYSTYLGGTGVDVANGIAVDSTGNAYIAGSTKSPNFPVLGGGAAGTNPFQGQLGGSGGNAFVAKISPLAAPSAVNFFPPSYNFHDDGIGGSDTETVTL
ncbi:MAG TPA: SBBP repeat-containing protein, partial [Candidatus Saccharimonadales bacterium]|nr:SBBP repeat-containing protein [Candidatus Saccharimonadales bacterium]